MFSSNDSWTITDDDAARELVRENQKAIASHNFGGLVHPSDTGEVTPVAIERAMAAADDAPFEMDFPTVIESCPWSVA